MSPNEILMAFIGNTGKDIQTLIHKYGYAEYILPLPNFNTHEEYERYVAAMPDTFEGLKEEVKKSKRVFLILGSDLESGVALLLLSEIKGLTKDLNVLLYLRGENASTEESLIENLLSGVLGNKARAGFFNLFLVRETELGRIYGDLLLMDNFEERYYQKVVDNLHLYNIFTTLKPTLTRSNKGAIDINYYNHRETFAKVMTFADFNVTEDSLEYKPFYDLKFVLELNGKRTVLNEEFLWFGVNASQTFKAQMNRVLPVISEAIEKRKDLKTEFNFFKVDDKTDLKLCILKTSNIK
jgi:hypothetical protein